MDLDASLTRLRALEARFADHQANVTGSLAVQLAALGDRVTTLETRLGDANARIAELELAAHGETIAPPSEPPAPDVEAAPTEQLAVEQGAGSVPAMPGTETIS